MTRAEVSAAPPVVPPGVKLCALTDLADPGARGIVVLIAGQHIHAFVVRAGGRVSGWLDRCPHMGLPLARTLDDYLAPDGRVACAWHGAVFDPMSGRCLGGPCAGAGLTPWPVAVVENTIVTA